MDAIRFGTSFYTLWLHARSWPKGPDFAVVVAWFRLSGYSTVVL